MTSNKLKPFLSVSLGHSIEYYDAKLFSYFYLIVVPFFTPSDPSASEFFKEWFPFIMFALAYAARPFGSVLMGYFGDKYGRRTALLSSIFMMILSSFIIALMPTFNSIGYLATFGIIFCRLLQGLSVAGEYGGSAVFVKENMPPSKIGYYGGWICAICFLGGALGAMVADYCFRTFEDETYGWRIPFFIGGCLGIVILYLRRGFEESKEFKSIKDKKKTLKFPLSNLIRENPKAFISGIVMGIQTNVPYFFVMAYFASILKSDFNLTSANISEYIIAVTVISAIVILISAYISDWYGRKKLMAVSALSMVVFAPIVFIFIDTAHQSRDLFSFIGYNLFITVIAAVFLGPLTAVLPSLFNTEKRYTGTAITYSLGAFIAALSPMLAKYITAQTGNIFHTFWILVISSMSAAWVINGLDIGKENLRKRATVQ